MPKQPTDDLQADAAGNKMRGMGMPIVVKAIIREFRLLSYAAPELLYVLQMLPGYITGEEVLLFVACSCPHLGKQSQCCRG